MRVKDITRRISCKARWFPATSVYGPRHDRHARMPRRTDSSGFYGPLKNSEQVPAYVAPVSPVWSKLRDPGRLTGAFEICWTVSHFRKPHPLAWTIA